MSATAKGIYRKYFTTVWYKKEQLPIHLYLLQTIKQKPMLY